MSAGSVLAATLVLCLASFAVGSAIWRLSGAREGSWLAPAAGLAALVALGDLAVELPGAGLTAAVALAAIAVLAAVIGLSPRMRGIGARVVRSRVVPVAAVALVVAFMPFIAAGHVGILAVGDNADFYAHTMLADAIRQGEEPVGVDPGWAVGYPRGPHSLAAAVSAGLGVPVDAALTALLLAILVVSAIAAGSLFADVGTGRRVVGAALAGMPYLAASYTVQTSFKETLLGVIVVAWALTLAVVARDVRRRPLVAAPLLALAAGAWADYGVVALAWLALVAVGYLALVMPRLDRAALPRAVLAVVVAAAAAGALTQFDQAERLIGHVRNVAQGDTTGGNVRAELPAYQVFGAWPRANLRETSGSLIVPRALALLAAAAALWSAWWWWRRRARPELPAAVAATLLVYAFSRATATPYYSGKALAVAAFATGAMTFGALMLALPPRVARGRAAVFALAGVVVLVAGASSTSLALRGAQVEPEQKRAELESLRPLLRGQPTLYMGKHNYAPWLLRGVRVAVPAIDIGRSQIELAFRPEKPWTPGAAFDWDNIAPEHVDRFRFAVVPRSHYASEPPPNWERVRTTPSYEVWRRDGPTPQRQVLPEPSAMGAVLDCSSRDGRALTARGGEARVRSAPIVIEPSAKRISAGDRITVSRELPSGRWAVGAQYASPTSIRVRIGATQLTAPPSLDPVGPFWHVGELATDGGRTTIELRADDAPALSAHERVDVGSLALVRTDDQPETLPLSDACGRYVDWYRGSP